MSRLSLPDWNPPALGMAILRGDKPCHYDTVFLAGRTIPLQGIAGRSVQIARDMGDVDACDESVGHGNRLDDWRQCLQDSPPLPGVAKDSPATRQRRAVHASAYSAFAPLKFAGFARAA